MWTHIKRIIRSGFIQFWRSSFVSLSSILVMVITLMVITSILFSSAILKTTLDDIRSKVDINVYFVPQATEESVLAVKTDLERLPEVAAVEYFTREQVLEDFRMRHEGDATILQSLDEIGENPLGAVLNVRAVQPDQYESIDVYLRNHTVTTSNGLPIIDKVNYIDNRTAIDRLTRIIDASERFGLGIMVLLVVLSIIITFNTIRLAIYISREEISVMRLVGASNKYIRGPFVVTGIICGIIAALFTLFLFYPVTFWLGGQTVGFFAGFNVFDYYIVNFVRILFIVLGSGIAIGAVSSWLAVHKYLR